MGRLRATFVGLLLFVTSGCSPLGYLAHVSSGQMQLLWAREELTPERIAQLEPTEQLGVEAVERARAFAMELGLIESSSYRHLLDRPTHQRVRVLVAAERNRLESVTWWFPIVGHVAYKGYFDSVRVERERQSLEAEGYDTYVREALLYSTLGWFDDPVPRDLLSYAPWQVLNIIVHELVHETLYVKGDTTYNESLASFIGQQATLIHLADNPETRARAIAEFEDQQRFATLIRALAEELEEVYATNTDASEARLAVFHRYQTDVYNQQGFGSKRYAEFQEIELSNAYVLANQTYLDAMPCLAQELEALGGKLERLIEAHRRSPGAREDCRPREPS